MSEKASGIFADSDIWHLRRLAHLFPPVSAHAHGEVHCRCRARRDFYFLPPVKSPQGLPVPLVHFPQARAVKGKSRRSSESLRRGIWQQSWFTSAVKSSEHLQPPLHASFPASFGDKLCVQQTKTSPGSKMRLMRSRQCVHSGDDQESRIGWDRRFEVEKHK